MRFKQFATGLTGSLLGIFVLTGSWTSPVLADHHPKSATIGRPQGDLIKIVRESTARFRDVEVAKQEGYQLMFGCVSGDAGGAMGLHFVNGGLIGDDVLDPTHPEIVIYEPLPNGRLRLIGADFLVLADVWHANHTETPQIMGQLLHLFESPNRFGLPNFYTLHVWAWKENPTGAFVNWHANVTCDAFTPETP
jgi:hypothetical protein